MGSFTSAAPSAKSTIASSGHADQIQGAPSASASAPAIPAKAGTQSSGFSVPTYDAFGDPVPVIPDNPGFEPGAIRDPFSLSQDFAGNTWAPDQVRGDVGGENTPAPAQPTPPSGPPPVLPPRPAALGQSQAKPLTRPMTGGARPQPSTVPASRPRTTMAPGEKPVFRGAGNKPENVKLAEQQNAEARKDHRAALSAERRQIEERAKQQREQQRAAERAQKNAAGIAAKREAAQKVALQQRAQQQENLRQLGPHLATNRHPELGSGPMGAPASRAGRADNNRPRIQSGVTKAGDGVMEPVELSADAVGDLDKKRTRPIWGQPRPLGISVKSDARGRSRH